MLVKSDLICVQISEFSLPDNGYVVAASRMGFFSKPIWCANNQPVNATWFFNDAFSAENDQTLYLMYVVFKPQHKIGTTGFINTQFACESL